MLGTYYWEADTLLRRATLLLNIAVYAVACAAMLVEVVRLRQRGGAPGVREWARWLLLLTLVTPFAMLYVSSFASRFDHESSRYVLPAYIPLFLAVAALVVRLWRQSRVAGAALLAFLLAFNVWTNLEFMWPLHPAERAARAAHIGGRQAILRHLERHPV